MQKSSIATVKTLEDRITHETTLRQAFEHKFENERQANQKIRLHVKEIEESMKPQFDALNEQIHKLENRITVRAPRARARVNVKNTEVQCAHEGYASAFMKCTVHE